jgi:hypothetical protein
MYVEPLLFQNATCPATPWHLTHSEAVPNAAHLRWLCLGEHRVLVERGDGDGDGDGDAGGDGRRRSHDGFHHFGDGERGEGAEVGDFEEAARASWGEGRGRGRGRRGRGHVERELAAAVEFDFLLTFLGRPEETEAWGDARDATAAASAAAASASAAAAATSAVAPDSWSGDNVPPLVGRLPGAAAFDADAASRVLRQRWHPRRHRLERFDEQKETATRDGDDGGGGGGGGNEAAPLDLSPPESEALAAAVRLQPRLVEALAELASASVESGVEGGLASTSAAYEQTGSDALGNYVQGVHVSLLEAAAADGDLAAALARLRHLRAPRDSHDGGAVHVDSP